MRCPVVEWSVEEIGQRSGDDDPAEDDVTVGQGLGRPAAARFGQKALLLNAIGESRGDADCEIQQHVRESIVIQLSREIELPQPTPGLNETIRPAALPRCARDVQHHITVGGQPDRRRWIRDGHPATRERGGDVGDELHGGGPDVGGLDSPYARGRIADGQGSGRAPRMGCS